MYGIFTIIMMKQLINIKANLLSLLLENMENILRLDWLIVLSNNHYANNKILEVFLNTLYIMSKHNKK